MCELKVTPEALFKWAAGLNPKIVLSPEERARRFRAMNNVAWPEDFVDERQRWREYFFKGSEVTS